MITNKTSKKYHLFYSDLAAQVSDKELQRFLTKNNLDIRQIKQFYRRDPFLRNMDEAIFDKNIHKAALSHETEYFTDEYPELTNACLWKWILVYRVLKARPIFVGTLFEMV